MLRRRFLAFVAASLPSVGGCTGGGIGGDATPGGSTTETATPTKTPPSLPERCPFAPAVEGLPAWPDELTAESVTAFVADYEETLAVDNPEYRGLNFLQHVSTRSGDDGYRVYYFAEPLPSTPTPVETDTATNASTPTPTAHPTDAPSTYNVGYFVDPHRVVRWKRPSALTYRFSPYDGYDPREGGDLVACRTET